MRSIKFLLASAVLATAGAASAAIPFYVSLESEAPGIQTSTSGFDFVGVETFNGRATGTGQNFTTDFVSGGVFSGTYTNAQINNVDQFGGADGSGEYAVTFTNPGFTLDLTTTRPGGVTYFGFWLSALDGNNSVTFSQGGVELFTFSATNARDFINGLPNAGSYYGNPNPGFAGQNASEPYAFLNFYAAGGARFDKVAFNQLGGGGYESDNHTVGVWNRMSGTIIPIAGGVPEPQTWALLIAGFSMVGFSLRRRERAVAA